MQTECLLEGNASPHLNVKVRFLQIVDRSVGRLVHPLLTLPPEPEPDFVVVDKLEVGGQTFVPWQEAMEREIIVSSAQVTVGSPNPSLAFEFPAGRNFEPLRSGDGLIAGVIIREWETISGSVEVDLKQCCEGVFKATVRISNLTPYRSPQHESRADALMYSFVSTHSILALENGEFISLIDPPEKMRGLVDECRNVGSWPVLVGDDGDRDTMLSSPIILYDYPQIAPESSGALFDGTEIDEILSLRILTMTDEEKCEMRQSDQRARQILERTESMPPEQFMKLHGALRGLRPVGKEAQ
jgi:hydrogenase maturation protease